MKKMLKYGLIASGIAIITLIGFIGYGLYLMEIEDHYGDIQNLYYNSKNGDIAVNKTISEFGTVEKTWKRIIIKTQNNNSVDLYNWTYQNGVENQIEIYRIQKSNIKLETITFSKLLEHIENFDLKLIIRN
jgi:hypothetical protein